ncbi:MAG: hypothetical protein OEX18_00070 [Candidatus Krumholzibacteria bacterium]|nr:hypothetical protein [Candidatus Krumholzibacteria bacterium]MDH4335656.1 hypothetical protein [Candidatus Krumholzibacteria bacterium]MDH5270449.1 hypothetical protein [Candidatus Krumholzibacteria bacterium]MDH5626784.1 hypothetical protein [Candidatus Krumholzibacteria bacterium]
MRTTTVIVGLCLCCLASSAPAQQQDPRIADVTSRVIDAYGGEEALRSVHGYHASGGQLAMQSETPIRVERWFARPDRLRLELAYPDHHETRITDGAQGWTGSSRESLEPANAMKLQAMRLQTARLDTPLRLLEQKDEVEWRDTDTDGRAVLRVPIDTGLYINYHVDPDTWHITHVTMGMAGPPSMEFSADYDDFREIDGVLIPFKEVTYAGGTVTSVYQMTAFEWNPKDLEDELSVGARNTY